MGIFVPLGIPDFNGGPTKGYITLKYMISGQSADKVDLEVRRGGTTFFKHVVTDSTKLGVGSHEYHWDGFDDNGILDTAFYTQNDFNFLSRIYVKGQVKFKTVKFKCEYDEVNWVDVKIDKNAKRIDVTLRVNLKDGGTRGIECNEQLVAHDPVIVRECPWDDIPDEKIVEFGKQPLKQRTKTFEELRQLALDGINTYWSRRPTNTAGTVANAVNWDIGVNAVLDENGMDAPYIIFFTNSSENNFTRSHNWELSRKLFYKIGYLREEEWDYQTVMEADTDFISTSAHEIGHEILLAYGGQMYSKKHKGTSTLLQSNTNENAYPETGEIDLMKYFSYKGPVRNYYKRLVASKEDVLSLVWLAKLDLK